MVGNGKAKKRKRGIVLTRHFRKEQNQFTEWLDRLGYATTTVTGHNKRIIHFFDFLQQEQFTHRKQLKNIHVDDYCKALKKLSIKSNSIVTHFSTVTLYSKYLEKIYGQKILYNVLTIEKEVVEEREILSPLEIKQLFNLLDHSPKGLLERSFLHLYYSCGLRAKEGARILPGHIDYHKKLLYVAPGKNYHSRYVPLSAKVAEELREYELYGRPIINNESPYFLVSALTNNMGTQITGRIWKQIKKQSGLSKPITLHGLRHSIATHLVQSGMPLESVQQFLGHNTLDATQIYVRMNYETL